MEFTVDTVREILAEYSRRVELIRLAGGIPMVDVVNGTAIVPPRWVRDYQTEYFVPPGFDPNMRLQ